ncbi:MAG: GGDEF domain-containing response regulator [Pseudomonadales bacterium]|nr:GGDEF domain-containing response regulator [Pseudomonadales bacterium]
MEANKILIVEDENIVALDMSRRLKKLGYDVIGTAASGKRALELVDARGPNVVLMDIHIKGTQDGIEVAQDINHLYRIPVIFLTAYSEDTTLNRARESGPYGYLLKPFSERELHVAIQVALDKHRFIEDLARREVHLKLAVNAARLSTWEANAEDESIVMGYSADRELKELSWRRLQEAIVESDRDRVAQALAYLRLHPQHEIDLEFQVDQQDSTRRWFRLCGKSFNGSKSLTRVVGILQEITEQKASQDKLKQAAIAFNCSADGIVILNKHRRIESINKAFSRITGLAEGDCLGQELDLLSVRKLGPEKEQRMQDSLQRTGCWQGESRFHDSEDRLVHALVNIGTVSDPAIDEVQYVVVVSDITPIRYAQKKLVNAAYYDSLTGLPNRNLFYDRLDTCISQAERRQHQFGLLYLDLDNFKSINDTLGHQMGDSFLRAVALRLRAALRSCDTLCRLGGDEFTVIVHHIDAVDELADLATKLQTILSKPLRIENNLEIVPRASVGISIYPDDTQDRDEMVRMADIAMYAAKRDSLASFAFFQPDMSTFVSEYFNRDQELHRALASEELCLHYQPQYDAHTGTLVGLEALIRWQHPEEGLLGAGEVIPFAETSSLILDIGRWVFEEACRQLQSWLHAGYDPKRISINVSARQLEDREFSHWVKALIEQYNVEYRFLDIEVTESCLQNSEVGIQNLFWIMEKGANISIDDFGTGFSCMHSLKSLPITALKIDQIFVRNLHEDESDKAICEAIIALSRKLRLRIIAEGVETEAQAEFLRRAGCDELQGYLMSKPKSSDEITKLLPVKTVGTHH